MKIFEILKENQEKDLTSLKRAKGWDDICGGDIDCDNLGLTSLKGAPKEVYGNFDCQFNKLTSLEGAPNVVDGNFYCRNNVLTSLKGTLIQVGRNLRCESNNLTSLNGGPTKIGRNFYCGNNPIKSLAGIGSYFKNGYIKGFLVIPHIVESHVLGTLLIPGLRRVEVCSIQDAPLRNATRIISKHLNGDRDILECQEELRTAGLREFGKL